MAIKNGKTVILSFKNVNIEFNRYSVFVVVAEALGGFHPVFKFFPSLFFATQ